MENKRDRAIELANKAVPIETGRKMPDAQVILSYALILVLADIAETLGYVSDNLDLIIAHGIGVEN